MLIELDIAVADTLDESIGEFGHFVAWTVHEVVVDKPLAHELLGELALRFALLKLLLVALGIEVATAIGRVDLVDEDDLAVALTELILCINEDEALFGSNLSATLKECTGVALHHLIILSADDALSDDFLLGDVLIVALVGFGRRCDDGFGKTLVFAHSIGKFYAA